MGEKKGEIVDIWDAAGIDSPIRWIHEQAEQLSVLSLDGKSPLNLLIHLPFTNNTFLFIQTGPHFTQSKPENWHDITAVASHSVKVVRCVATFAFNTTGCWQGTTHPKLHTLVANGRAPYAVNLPAVVLNTQDSELGRKQWKCLLRWPLQRGFCVRLWVRGLN